MKRTGLGRTKKPVKHPVVRPKTAGRVRPSPRPSARQRAATKARARKAAPGYAAWKKPSAGKCAICGRKGPRFRHHIVTEAHVRAAGGDPWDLRNALQIGVLCCCHANHHHAVERISMSKVPDDAIDFAIELLGQERAALYFARFYGRGT